MSVARWLDRLSDEQARSALGRCCGASGWAVRMLARRPFGTDDALFAAADAAWAVAPDEDVLEALAHHPEIGADVQKLRAKFASTVQWAEGEQAGVGAASEQTLLDLSDGNVAYKAKFGHIFVVCATSKTAAQMLDLLRARLPNDPQTELAIAAAEQGKITRLRLEKLADTAAAENTP